LTYLPRLTVRVGTSCFTFHLVTQRGQLTHYLQLDVLVNLSHLDYTILFRLLSTNQRVRNMSRS